MLLYLWFTLIWCATWPCCEKVEFWPFVPTPRVGWGGGGDRGLQAKYLLPCCRICDSFYFDIQHVHVLKKMNFDQLTPSSRLGWGVGGLRGLQAKYLLPCCCIPDSINLICNMTMFWKSCNLTFSPYPQGQEGGGGGVCGQNVCYHVAAFVIPFNLIFNMTMLWKW